MLIAICCPTPVTEQACCSPSTACLPAPRAQVGLSGSGKTTVCALLQRLYDPAGGAILLDGQLDLRQADAAWYRTQIGVVPQVRAGRGVRPWLGRHEAACEVGPAGDAPGPLRQRVKSEEEPVNNFPGPLTIAMPRQTCLPGRSPGCSPTPLLTTSRTAWSTRRPRGSRWRRRRGLPTHTTSSWHCQRWDAADRRWCVGLVTAVSSVGEGPFAPHLWGCGLGRESHGAAQDTEKLPVHSNKQGVSAGVTSQSLRVPRGVPIAGQHVPILHPVPPPGL